MAHSREFFHAQLHANLLDVLSLRYVHLPPLQPATHMVSTVEYCCETLRPLTHAPETGSASRRHMPKFDARFRRHFFVPMHEPKLVSEVIACMGTKNWRRKLASKTGVEVVASVSGACVRGVTQYTVLHWQTYQCSSVLCSLCRHRHSKPLVALVCFRQRFYIQTYTHTESPSHWLV